MLGQHAHSLHSKRPNMTSQAMLLDTLDTVLGGLPLRTAC
jgi:hypothetical protein